MSWKKALFGSSVMLVLALAIWVFQNPPGPLSREKVISAISIGRYGLLDRAKAEGWLDPKKLGEPPLHLALEKNNVGSLARLLNLKLDPNLRNKKGETALHLAAASGNLTAMRRLLGAKADPNVYDLLDESPLVAAARLGRRDAANLLLGKGAREELWAGLYLADPKLLKSSLAKGHSPNLLNRDGVRPLAWALKQENLDQVRVLLAHPQLLVLPSDSLYFRPEWFEQFFFRLGGLRDQCQLGELMGRNFSQDPVSLQKTCSTHPDLGFCTLQCEASARIFNPTNPWLAKADIKRFKPLTGLNRYLLCAARKELWQDKEAWDWFHTARPEVLKAWLKKGSQPHIPLCLGLAPLHLAVLKNNQQMVQALVDKRANLNQRVGQIRPEHRNLGEFPVPGDLQSDSEGETALLLALQNNQPDPAGFLLMKRANPHYQDRRGNSPVLWVLEHRQMDSFSMFLDLLQDIVFQYGPEKRTILHSAAAIGDRKTVDLMLRYEAWPEIKDAKGNSPGDLALKAGAFGLAKTLKLEEELAPLSREKDEPEPESPSLSPANSSEY